MIFDIVIAVLLIVVGLIQGKKGFFSEFSKLSGYILGLFLAIISSRLIIGLVEQIITVEVNPVLLSYLVYILLFIAYYLLVRWLGNEISNFIKNSKVAIVDNVLGFILGVVECFVVISLLLVILNKQHFFDLNIMYVDSKIYKYVFSFIFDYADGIQESVMAN